MADDPLLNLSKIPDFRKLSDADQITRFTQEVPDFGRLSPVDQRTKLIEYRQRAVYGETLPEQRERQGVWGQLSEFGSELAGAYKGASDVAGVLNPLHPERAAAMAAGTAQAARDFAKGRQTIRVGPVPVASVDKKLFSTVPGLWQAGAYGQAAVNLLNSLIPVIGPEASSIADDVNRGDYGKAVGRMAPYIAPELARRLPASMTLGLTSQLPAADQQAIRDLELTGNVRFSTGQKTGAPWVQHTEKDLSELIGSRRGVQTWFGKQPPGVAQTARDLTATVSPTTVAAPDRVRAGRAYLRRINNRLDNLWSIGDRSYDAARQNAASAQQTLQVGTQTTTAMPPGQSMAHGVPVTTTTPIMKTFNAPVDAVASRAGLQPLYDDLDAKLTVEQKQYSPAFQALKEFIESKSPYIDAMDLDKYNSAVKSLLRRSKNAQARGLAVRILQKTEADLNTAMQQAGPNAVANLRRGRAAVRQFYETKEFLARFGKNPEPAAVVNRLLANSDKRFSELEMLNRFAPQQGQLMARMYLEELTAKATKQGGFDAAGVQRMWDNMGPRTKDLLLGPQKTRMMDSIIRGGKLIQKYDPEHTWMYSKILGRSSTIADAALLAISTGHMVPLGQALAALGVGATAVPAVLSRLFFSDAGLRALNTIQRVPLRTPAYGAALANLGVAVTHEAERQRQEDKEEEQQQPAATGPRSRP